MNTAIVNFNSGEMTAKIDARSDTEKYAGGCRQLENMIPLIFGGAEKRPGTEFISTNGAFNTMLASIVAYENIVVCYENDVSVTNFSALLDNIICYENDVICYENEVVSGINIPFLKRAMCCENDLIFYEGDVVYI